MTTNSAEEIWRPHVTVAAIAEQKGRFLIVEELSDGRAVYNQPAGHLEPQETLLEAVIRETLEESAYHFVPTALVGIYSYTSKRSGITYQRFSFAGYCENHQPDRPLDKDILSALWLSREELVAQSEKLRSPMVLLSIDDYLKGQRYPLSVLIDVK